MSLDPRLVKAFYQAALFLKHRVEEDGWNWSSNFLREYVRCATSLKFTNSESPQVLRAVRRKHPELEKYIKIKPTKAKPMLTKDFLKFVEPFATFSGDARKDRKGRS